MIVRVMNVSVALTDDDMKKIIRAMKKKLKDKRAIEEFYEAFIDRWNFSYGFLGVPLVGIKDLKDMATIIAVINYVLKLQKNEFETLGEALDYINEHIERAINRILDYRLTKQQTEMYRKITEFLGDKE